VTSPPLPDEVTANSSGLTCLYCSRPRHARKMCGTHYQRWRNHGDPFIIGHTGGAKTLRREGEAVEPTYNSQHRKIERARGKPQHCEHCGSSDPGLRYDWAFNNTGDRNDVQAYLRLCHLCHSKFDAHLMPRGAQHWNAQLNEALVLEIRRLHAEERISYRKLGQRFGIPFTTISDIIARRTWRLLPDALAD